MSVQAIEVQETILRREYNNSLSNIVIIGLAYKLKGQWDIAEELEV